jgi:hypothetical protein
MALKCKNELLSNPSLSTAHQFNRASGISADIERVLITVVARPNLERKADHFEVVHTVYFLRIFFICEVLIRQHPNTQK